VQADDVAPDAGALKQPRSRWNRYTEALLAAKLTAAEHRLALAFMRLIPGYRLEERDLGNRLLREVSGLDGRSFERARAGLIEKGLIHYEPGDVARRSHYRLAYGVTAVERSGLEEDESGQGVTAPERSGGDRPRAVRGVRCRAVGADRPRADT
jgi:hypothetical protein